MTADLSSALVVGGTGPDDLRRSVESLTTPPQRTWCAVASPEEAAAVAGVGVPFVLGPWPGRAEALQRLYALVGDGLPEGIVVLLAGGTILRRRFLSRVRRALRRAAVVLSTPGRRPRGRTASAPLGRFTVRLLTEAVLRPTSGTALTTSALAALADRGWLGRGRLTLGEVQSLVGPAAVLPRSVDAAPSPARPRSGRRLTVTVLIPAYNEQAWIGETLRSVQRQTRKPDEVIVIDDGSTDRTAEVAGHYGVRVVRGIRAGSKAGAQNLALPHVRTDAVVVADADTALHAEAIEHLLAHLEAGMDGVSGGVLPRWERGVWSRGRMMEYALGLRLHKRVQSHLGTLLVISGCVAAFRTDVLREIGGLDATTLTEDLELTWRLHLLGYRVGYAREGLAYPVEPYSWPLYKAQMRRWAGGFFQGVLLHRRKFRRRPMLGFLVVAAIWDIVSPAILLATFAALVAAGGLGEHWQTLFLWQAAILAIGAVLASRVLGVRRTLQALPAYTLILYLGQYFYLEAFLREFVLRRRRTDWVKGH
ncbi:MAG TPA: glycosyltransferase family 2 protein [Actinomycetota bacterium]|nr:glycosyltransferase family 2 protein [Actinomycetota bacterium]